VVRLAVDIVINLKQEIENVVKELGYYTEDFEAILEIPKEKLHGDYSTNMAMRLAKVAKKSPLVIAKEFIDRVDHKKMHIEKIEIAGPGFINFFLDKDYILGITKEIIVKQDHYGDLSIGNGIKVNIEFVSANPTGALHIGHGRGAAYGDSLARVLSKIGYDVSREHYVNDAGNQIRNLALSIIERYKELHGLPFYLGDDHYHGKEITAIAKEIKQEYSDQFIKNPDFDFFRTYGTNYLLKGLQNDLREFNIEFDVWFSERSLYENHVIEKTIDKLVRGGFTYQQDGAVWLKTSEYGDEKDRVIIKSDGSYTYLLPDIAYHANKLSRGFDRLIDVLGADHHGYINRLKAAVAMVGGNSNMIDIEILQMVRALRNGEEIKMSKRSGKAITLRDLIDEVGSSALRYFYISKSLDTPMDLDVEFMTKKSNENPVYYAQYAYARIASLFRTLEKNGLTFTPSFTFENINKENAKELGLLLMQYPSAIEEAGTKRLPHKITHYITNLASSLHSYYNDEKIITENLQETNEKLTLMKAVSIVLKNAFQLIGVEAVEQM
jgi:arginyl-tRNA synthetase